MWLSSYFTPQGWGWLRGSSNHWFKVSYNNFEVVLICYSNAVSKKDVWDSQRALFYLRNQSQNSFMPSGDFLRLWTEKVFWAPRTCCSVHLQERKVQAFSLSFSSADLVSSISNYSIFMPFCISDTGMQHKPHGIMLPLNTMEQNIVNDKQTWGFV